MEIGLFGLNKLIAVVLALIAFCGCKSAGKDTTAPLLPGAQPISGLAVSSMTPEEGGLIWITTTRSGEWVVSDGEKQFPSFEIQGGRRALVAVEHGRPAGPYSIKAGSQELILDTRSAHYGTEKLNVDPSRVNPPKSARARIERERMETRAIYQTVTPELIWEGGPFALPIQNGRPASELLTSPYGTRRMFNGELKSAHLGLDLRARVGTPIVAPARGRVVLAKSLYYSGGTVILDHGYGFYTLYAHLSRIQAKVGDTVSIGAPLGLAGATGRVTGPHLHWTAIVHQTRFNPKYLFELPAHR